MAKYRKMSFVLYYNDKTKELEERPFGISSDDHFMERMEFEHYHPHMQPLTGRKLRRRFYVFGRIDFFPMGVH